jgi:hypothetical protein
MFTVSLESKNWTRDHWYDEDNARPHKAVLSPKDVLTCILAAKAQGWSPAQRRKGAFALNPVPDLTDYGRVGGPKNPNPPSYGRDYARRGRPCQHGVMGICDECVYLSSPEYKAAAEANFQKRIRGVINHNVGEFMRMGPGLRYTTKIAKAAKCPSGLHVLETGLGAMGVGSLWRASTLEDKADPEWDVMPVQSDECSGDDGTRLMMQNMAVEAELLTATPGPEWFSPVAQRDWKARKGSGWYVYVEQMGPIGIGSSMCGPFPSEDEARGALADAAKEIELMNTSVDHVS